MRLPGTLKALYEQLEAAPGVISRVTVPTKNGPFILEFDVSAPRKLASVPATPEKKPPPSKPAKVRDLDVLRKQAADPPHFRYEEEPSAAG